IGIDRAVEGNIGRVVAGDDLARGVDRHRRLEGRQVFDLFPAVVEGDARQRLIATGRIRMGAAAASAVALDGRTCLARRRWGQRRRRACATATSGGGVKLGPARGAKKNKMACGGRKGWKGA